MTMMIGADGAGRSAVIEALRAENQETMHFVKVSEVMRAIERHEIGAAGRIDRRAQPQGRT